MFFRAFDIKCSPQGFTHGFFIFDRLELYQPILERLGRPLTDEKRRRHRPSALTVLFPWLREYRREVLRAKDSYQGFLSCPPAVWRFLEDVVQPLADSIAQCLAPIDAVLAELIAPDGRTFTLEALIADHGHPTENFLDLQRADEDAFFRAAFGDDADDADT